jgi:hypothetical protein
LHSFSPEKRVRASHPCGHPFLNNEPKRELRAAFNRRGRETMLARHSARIALRDELKDDLTSLLFTCGMALGEPGLSEVTLTRTARH